MKYRFLIITLVASVLLCCNNTERQQNVVKVLVDSLIEKTRVERDSAFRNVKSAKIIVRQYYDNANHVSLPFKEVMASLLQYTGIKEDSLNYNMIVRIDAMGSALGLNYETVGYNYSGASLRGSVTIESMSGEKYTEEFNETIEPFEKIFRRYSPNDAPFMCAFNQSIQTLIKSLYKPFGITPIIISLKDPNYWHCNSSAVVGKSQEAMDYDSKNNRSVNNMAKEILNMIHISWRQTESAKNAVPIFIASLKIKDQDIDNAALVALQEITGKNFLEGHNYNVEKYQEWWENNK